MIKLEKIVDERQELELFRIERMGFWIMYWLLLAAFLMQSLFMDVPSSQYAGEFIVFMSASAYLAIACIRKGQWDYYSRPSLKSYFIYSLIGSLVFTLLFTFSGYLKYAKNVQDLPLSALFGVLVVFGFLFLLMFTAMTVVGTITKRRQAQLEREFDAEQE